MFQNPAGSAPPACGAPVYLPADRGSDSMPPPACRTIRKFSADSALPDQTCRLSGHLCFSPSSPLPPAPSHNLNTACGLPPNRRSVLPPAFSGKSFRTSPPFPLRSPRQVRPADPPAKTEEPHKNSCMWHQSTSEADPVPSSARLPRHSHASPEILLPEDIPPPWSARGYFRPDSIVDYNQKTLPSSVRRHCHRPTASCNCPAFCSLQDTQSLPARLPPRNHCCPSTRQTHREISPSPTTDQRSEAVPQIFLKRRSTFL